MSYPALKHWILAGRIQTVKTPGGDRRVTAIITADAVRDLTLKPGDSAGALIKATEVMIVRP